MILIYILTKDKEEAIKIGSELIDKKLTHSINILPEIFSMRRVGNKIVDYHETILLVKTKALLYQDIEKFVSRVLENHSPTMFSLPITQINRDLFKLIQNNTVEL